MITITKAHAKALAASINKWQRIVDKRGTDNPDNLCPLCRYAHVECNKCIIGMATGVENCLGTPYRLWYRTQREAGKQVPFKAYNTHTLKIARLMLSTLKYIGEQAHVK